MIKISDIIKYMLVTDPFYGIFLMGVNVEENNNISTLCVARDGFNIKLMYNSSYLESLSNELRISALKHEIHHIMFKHIFDFYSFEDKKLANIAMDAEVNGYLEVTDKNWIHAEDFGYENFLGTNEYYRLLSEKFDDINCNFSFSGFGSGSDDSDDGSEKTQKTAPGSHEWESGFSECTSAEKDIILNKIDFMISEAKNSTERNCCGNVPGFVSELLKNKRKLERVVPWHQYLRNKLGIEYDIICKRTRKRQNRFFPDSMGKKKKRKVNILVAIDTSGSLTTSQFYTFVSEINHIYHMGASIDILTCDTDINEIYRYKGKIDHIKGRGGTDFNPPIDYYIKNKRIKGYELLVYFTDGGADLPANRPKNMVWVIDKGGCHQDYPGTAIYIPDDFIGVENE